MTTHKDASAPATTNNPAKDSQPQEDVCFEHEFEDEVLEHLFDTFRQASAAAAEICRQHETGASLERRGERWAVVLKRPGPEVMPAVDGLMLQNQLLRGSLALAERDRAVLQEENVSLRARVDVNDREHKLLEPLLTRDTPGPFDQFVVSKMNQEQANLLLRYGYLLSLKELKEIDTGSFDDFSAASGLWRAIHNYEKIKMGPQPVHNAERPHLNVEHCSSCGGIVINGHCKCSN